MTPFPRSRRDVTPLSPRVEELLGGLSRKSAPEGTLERILAIHASGSVYADTHVPRGRLLSMRDFVRVAIPSAAAAAAVVVAVGVSGSSNAPRASSPLAMVRYAGVPEASPAAFRVVNDEKLPAYALSFVSGSGP